MKFLSENKEKNIIKTICIQCGFEFFDFKCDKRKYCSRKCCYESPIRSEKLRQANLGKPMPKEHKEKLRLINTGRKPSKETNEKRRKAMTGRFQSEEKRRKCREAASGSKNHFWKGGLTATRKRIMATSEYKKWRSDVFKRDNWTCQECGARGCKGISVEINADHIKPFSLFPELRFDINNGRTLCRPCHIKTETWGKHTRVLTRIKMVNEGAVSKTGKETKLTPKNLFAIEEMQKENWNAYDLAKKAIIIEDEEEEI